jgi:peptidyl-dipeptidase Dcp
MKKSPFLIMTLIVLQQITGMAQNYSGTNPLLLPYAAQYGAVPFDKIEAHHFEEAIYYGMDQQMAGLKGMYKNEEDPTFENTIEVIEKSSETLDQILAIFYNLTSANTSPELQELAKKMAPVISNHRDAFIMAEEFSSRVLKVYQNRSALDLNPEQHKLLEETYKRFKRGGAFISADDKIALQSINQKMSTMALVFGDNVLAETNTYKLVIEDPKDLAGLPESVISAANAKAAKAEKQSQIEKWVFDLSNSSIMPFLQYADNRELRKEILEAYLNRGNNDNEYNNEESIKTLVNLRLAKAQLLGYESHAAFVLEESMAKDAETVRELLNNIWDVARPMAEKEEKELLALAKLDGIGSLEAWDWRYYTEKLRKQKFDLDEEELRAYFELERVRDGMFGTINKLFGLQFKPVNNVPVYHEEVEVFEVRESDGKYVGILYMDLFPRASKRGGAWMTSFRKQYKLGGQMVHPHISIVCNFTRPTEDKPALLSADEVTTLFHEMGHALHGLLSNVEYRSLSGTSVPRDFVELPSQILENWAMDPTVLKTYARHYKTNAVIPDALIQKMENSKHFNMGYVTTEYVAASLLDMEYHNRTEPLVISAKDFEYEHSGKIHLPNAIPYRYKSTYFSHIFSGGYSSGYYSYIYAEILDADAFDAFKSKGLFEQSTAKSFRQNILEKGGTEDPLELYIKFRGRKPEIGPLMSRRGLAKP